VIAQELLRQRRANRPPSPIPTRRASFPGDEFEKLSRWAAVNDETCPIDCGCSETKRMMNVGGPGWCRKNLDLLIHRVQTAARLRIEAGCFVPPHNRLVIRLTLVLAIKRSERKNAH
jgi:hypothetical protein